MPVACASCNRINPDGARFCGGCGHALSAAAPGARGGGSPFVGRERELVALRSLLEGARAGRGGVALLAGEPGIGKTRLAEELAGAARAQGTDVLWGRCYEGEGAPAFWPWTQILRTWLRGAGPGAKATGGDAAAAAIARLVAGTDGGDAGTGVRTSHHPARRAPGGSPHARFRLFDAVTALLTDAARVGPLVLVLDDLHWADTPSLLLLAFLARELRDVPLLVVATYRDVEVGRQHPLARTLAELARESHVHRLVLGGLGAADIARFAQDTAGVALPAPLVAALAEQTDGNPFFVTEVVRLLVSEDRLVQPAAAAERLELAVPAGVRAVIGRRLERLSPACNEVLTVAAVIGREFGVSELQAATGRMGESLLDVLEEAETARLIVAVPAAAGRYRFAHALVRETLYEDLPAARRVRLHRRAGEAIEALYNPTADSRGAGAGVAQHGVPPAERLAELAHHFSQAAPGGDVAKALAYARRAGDQALALLAYEEAAGHYDRALRLLDLAPVDGGLRCELLLARGEALHRAGEIPAARAAFEQAAELARRPAAPQRLARAALGYGGAGVEIGVVNQRLIDLLEEALAALGAVGRAEEGGTLREEEGALRARLLARLAMELYFADARPRRAALSEEAVEAARRLADPATLAFALNARHFSLWEPENLADRLAACDELLRVAEAAGDRELVLEGHAWRVADLLESGDIEAARREIVTHARLAEELRQPVHLWHAARFRGLQAYLDGRLGEVEGHARRALAIAERAQLRGADMLGVSQIQFVRRDQGRLVEMEAPIREIMARYPRVAESWRLALANLYAQAGRVAEARREIAYLADTGFAAIGRDMVSLGVSALLAEAVAAAGDPAAAAQLYERLLPYAGRYLVNGATPNFYGAAALYLGMLAATMMRRDTAIAHFEEALGMNERTGVRPLVARCQVALAEALLARGRSEGRPRALDLLAPALDTALEVGMPPLAERAERLWHDARRADGAGPHTAPPAGLTPREAEVLRLLAAGMSNKEIAAALVVTVNTVERHLVNIYGKLGVRGRAAATAYALRHGLADG